MTIKFSQSNKGCPFNEKKHQLEDSAAAQFDTARFHKWPGGCPISKLGAAFNPFAAPFLDDPYEFLKEALREDPVSLAPK